MIMFLQTFWIQCICYSKSTESVNQQNSCVWSKISYWLFYQTLTKYIYLESAHRDLCYILKYERQNYFVTQ